MDSNRINSRVNFHYYFKIFSYIAHRTHTGNFTRNQPDNFDNKSLQREHKIKISLLS